ncbi:DNA-binding protein [Lentilactobacillus laojiaonis]|uniref:DNA-binding protein n=1 Tax=Lentilactobacillus laojiaonis TaxID=2883998 RepID=UPI001D0AF1DB|nr:DNA-binding protein [Lentilactobacillus laojiaonis]UDM32352.1 DNA-binding protein [Lentilactobacillus laojiaonis]
MTPQEKFTQEQVQVEQDHHTPTAGAMDGHVLANLKIHQQKLLQAANAVSGMESLMLRRLLMDLTEQEGKWYLNLLQNLWDLGESVPTMTNEFIEYTMLQENGSLKYETNENLLAEISADLVTQTLFTSRAIKLAEKEDKLGLRQINLDLHNWLVHQVKIIQGLRGKNVQAAFDEDED